MSSQLKNQFVSGVFWSVGDKLVNQLGFLGVNIYLARLIGPEAFGLIGMLTIFTLLAESVVNNGFSQALVQKSKNITEDDSSTIFYVNLLWGIGIYTALYFLAPIIADFYRVPELTKIARLLFLIIIINSFVVVVRAKLLILVDFKSYALAASVGIIISSFIAITLAHKGYSYWSLVWLMLSRALVTNITLWLLCRWRPRLLFSSQSFKSLFKFGSNLMLAGFVATLVNNLYVVLIGRYFSASSVGYFTQATNLTNFLSQFVSSTLQGVTYPLFTSIKHDHHRLIRLYKKVISIVMFAALPILFGFAAIADSFVMLFLGKEWLEAVAIIQILCFSRAITPISAINMNILNAVGRSDLFLKVDLLKLPITLTTLFFSIPYGVNAVALALLVNSFLSYFINAYYPGKMFGFGAIGQFKAAKNYMLSALLMFFVVESISIEAAWLDMLCSVFVGATVYIGLLYFLRDVNLKLVFDEVKSRLHRR